jgi:hypothetical protein
MSAKADELIWKARAPEEEGLGQGEKANFVPHVELSVVIARGPYAFRVACDNDLAGLRHLSRSSDA